MITISGWFPSKDRTPGPYLTNHPLSDLETIRQEFL